MRLTSVLNKHLPIKSSSDGSTLLNIGCGQFYHSDWNNIDLVSLDPLVKEFDIRKGLPFADNSFDVVYHSHIVEHLDRNEILPFLRNCFRIIKPGGIIRIATPDLEQIARNYLLALEKSIDGDKIWEMNYDWMMLELYDQTVRKSSGGEMGKYLYHPNLKNEEFVVSRIGTIVNQYRNQLKKHKRSSLSTKRMMRAFYYLRVKLAKIFIYLLIGKKGTEALSEGLFRQSGEVHFWMYDKFSIKRLLLEAGYINIKFHSAITSSIPHWKDYNLNSDFEGNPYKPDSLYVEAMKSKLYNENRK